MSICNQDDLSIDDLSLKARFKAGRALFMDQSKRDSVVLDSFFEVRSLFFFQYLYFSLFPGAHRLPLTPALHQVHHVGGFRLFGTMPDQTRTIPSI
jgi:hypothetical protein